MKLSRFILFIICWGIQSLSAQTDKKELTTSTLLTNSIKNISLKKDSIFKPKHIPKIATQRSAIIPGWGQAYNRDYWKIPIVYAALAIPVYTFVDNNNYYKMCKFAYDAVYAATANKDSSLLKFIDPKVKRSDGSILQLIDYQNYKNSFRKNRDYSIFWFLILWGLNVADATVFAHLKDFDVSSDLALHLQPNFNPITKLPEIGFVFKLKNTSKQLKNIAR